MAFDRGQGELPIVDPPGCLEFVEGVLDPKPSAVNFQQSLRDHGGVGVIPEAEEILPAFFDLSVVEGDDYFPGDSESREAIFCCDNVILAGTWDPTTKQGNKKTPKILFKPIQPGNLAVMAEILQR